MPRSAHHSTMPNKKPPVRGLFQQGPVAPVHPTLHPLSPKYQVPTPHSHLHRRLQQKPIITPTPAAISSAFIGSRCTYPFTLLTSSRLASRPTSYACLAFSLSPSYFSRTA